MDDQNNNKELLQNTEDIINNDSSIQPTPLPYNNNQNSQVSNVIYYPPQNISQTNRYENIKNISEIQTKYISQPDENTFIIKNRCTTSYLGLIIFLIALSGFIALSIIFEIIILQIVLVFFILTPISGLICWVFSIRVTLGDNFIIIKENKCLRYSKRKYMSGELIKFFRANNDIGYKDNKGKLKSFGPQDYTEDEIEYIIYKLNTHIQLKMIPS